MHGKSLTGLLELMMLAQKTSDVQQERAGDCLCQELEAIGVALLQCEGMRGRASAEQLDFSW